MKQLTTQEMESVQGGFFFASAFNGAVNADKKNPSYDLGHDVGTLLSNMISSSQNAAYNIAKNSVSAISGFFGGLFCR